MSRQALMRAYAIVAGALVAAAVVAAVALAKGATAPTVGSAMNAKLGAQVVVNPQGRTLYALSAESSRRILCKRAECVRNWPPLTVSSSKVKLRAGAGVQGRLELVRRGSRLQVTLRGKPLYRFAGDHGKDEDNGEGIAAFGGTWHAVTASSASAAKPSQPSTTTESPAPYATSTPETPPSAPTYPSTSTTPTTPSTTSTPTTTTPTYTYPY